MNTPFPYPLIGMVHLLPLPGSPGYGGSLNAILDRAASDAMKLEQAGFDAVMIENYGDVPFHKERVEPVTVAAMTQAAIALRGACGLPFGVQVLRNDAQSSMSIAAVTGAAFIRVNVHTGAMLTDQGIIEGRADETLRLRNVLEADVKIFADVFVKHARPLTDMPVEEAARDAVHRGLADALIVSGSATGAPVDLERLRAVKAATDAPVIVGSGATEETIRELLQNADAAIVGTSIKEGSVTAAPVNLSRARALCGAVKGN